MPIGKEKIFELAKGFRGRAKNCIKIARNRVEKALQHSFRGRKEKKATFRELWITRIGAGCREHGVRLGELHGESSTNHGTNMIIMTIHTDEL